MDKERYVVVEIPDGSLQVGFDDTVSPSNPIEDPNSITERRLYVVFMVFNKWCMLFTNINAFMLLIVIASTHYTLGIMNLFFAYYTAIIINIKINLRRYHKIHGYLPFFLTSVYTNIITVYVTINSMWLLCAYYFSWFVLSLATILTVEYKIEELVNH